MNNSKNKLNNKIIFIFHFNPNGGIMFIEIKYNKVTLRNHKINSI